MKKLLLILIPFVIAACNGDKPASTDSIEEVKDVVKTEPDITMSAADLANNTLKNESFVTDRIGKKIKLTNVTIGGSENLGGGRVNLWGNDGDVHWNGEYMCCRYIFKVTDQEEVRKAENVKNAMATVMATLVDYRETQNTPPYSNTPVRLKEFIFEDVVITEKAVAAVPVAEHQPAQQVDAPIEANVTKEGEEKKDPRYDWDNQVEGTIVVDQAYFHDDPDVNTRRKSYLIKGDKVMYHPGGTSEFTMVSFKKDDGWLAGWMLKSDILKID